MQVELLRDGSFTEVHEESIVEPNVINDEEPFVQDSNTSYFDVKQPISLMPLNMDIKPKITSSSELEQIHSGEDQERQHNDIEPAIETRLPSSSNKSAANLIQRKRTLPMNDRQSRTKISSKSQFNYYTFVILESQILRKRMAQKSYTNATTVLMLVLGRAMLFVICVPTLARNPSSATTAHLRVLTKALSINMCALTPAKNHTNAMCAHMLAHKAVD
ncbi:hypothetical protein DdX_20821 [Ditylenchus destructor]|uniref:Uncharacterized protein n=1 Tax=Ditylenchus destructor TaxID=166010 RepID=A0AAD4MFS5_9BILA|nr:hypothetical protein DdX_20821 [Ditylenchus destructor]